MGVILGYNALPDKLKAGITAISDKKFEYTDHSFNTITESTVHQAIKAIEQTGGRVERGMLFVRTQAPKSWKLQIWDDYGDPVERIPVTDARWTWTGDWNQGPQKFAGNTPVRLSSVKGAEASISFQGTGAIVTGFYMPSGGKADVYLDGRLDRTVDVYPDENSFKGGEAVWHSFGLKNTNHTVKLAVRGETYPGSSGSDISISDLVVFR
jgi:hypothetical protein